MILNHIYDLGGSAINTSVVRITKILELLRTKSQGLTIKEISGHLSMPQSTTFNLVTTLYQTHLLSKVMGKRYKLGPRLIQLGHSAMESLDIHQVSQSELTNVMKKTNLTVFMAVLSGEEMIYINKIDSESSIKTTAQIGSKKPLYCTGLGKVFLAFLPESEREQILEKSELLKITENTITNITELKKQLTTFRKFGYSIDREESEEGLYCFAAPVFNSDNQIEAAISVAGPKETVIRKEDIIIKELLECAKRISFNLGNI